MARLNLTALRKYLKANNVSWSIPKKFRLSAIKYHPLGGDDPTGTSLMQPVKIDLKKIIDANTANPFLLERRKALGFAKAKKSAHEIDKTLLKELIKPALSSAVDWRNRWGWPWITKVKDQGGCESCWTFTAVGVVESMVRIEHAVWSKRSESDVHDGMGALCANGGNARAALDWITANGVADQDCVPDHNDDVPHTPTADRSGRTVKIPTCNEMSDVNDQKTWLDTVGPISLWFQLYTDFDAYFWAGATGVYRYTGAPGVTYRGNHYVLVVGYDDSQSCWICKNSWGGGGESGTGFFRIGYGEVGCDTVNKCGVKDTNPDPWTKHRLHNGVIIESGDGALHRNFEMLATSGTSIKHWWRDGSSFAWAPGPVMAGDAAACPTFTGTTFNRNFEGVYLTNTNRLHHWWFSQASGTWNDGGVFGPLDAAGIPGFIQGNYGAPGNFEVVVKTGDGRLNHWWRDGAGWHDGGRFGSDILLSGATLIQPNGGNLRNLELVAVNDSGQMQRFWRDDDHGFVWNAAETFGSGIGSTPVMIQGQFGAVDEDAPGNYELCVAAGGGFQHWWRDGAGNWQCSGTFGSNVTTVVGLIEGSFGFNLELIVITWDNQLQHYWRDGAGWHAGPVIGSL